MNRKECRDLADALLRKANQIKFNDYLDALKVINECRHFISAHKNYINLYILEEIEKAEREFISMSEVKVQGDKIRHWKEGIEHLRSGIQAITEENSYPI